jgi:flagellar basal body rod protein FlgG
MGGLLDTASSIVSVELRRVEAVGQNIANIATPGYKRQLTFARMLDSPKAGLPTNQTPAANAAMQGLLTATDFSAGRLTQTNVPTHLAIGGSGFFEIRNGQVIAYTRNGAMQRDEQGRLVNASGWALQAEGGGDVRIRGNDFRVETDGTVVEQGKPVARIRIVDFADRRGLTRSESGAFVAATGLAVPVENLQVRQGFAESSNVSTADDMVHLMESMRRAETGQKLVHAYDDMLGAVLRQSGDSGQ